MITFTLETITPLLAAQYLARNLNNRAITKERVLSLSRDMQSGAFLVTHQCIAFNSNGGANVRCKVRANGVSNGAAS